MLDFHCCRMKILLPIGFSSVGLFLFQEEVGLLMSCTYILYEEVFLTPNVQRIACRGKILTTDGDIPFMGQSDVVNK